jgi:ubiquitin carboxyl-terminal hydrolase 48
MFANEMMDLREENEVHNIDSDFEERPVKKLRREAERGFEGTVLSGGIDEPELSKNLCLKSHDGPSGDHPQVLNEKICAVCTLLNALDAAACKICDTPFV